MTTNEDPTTKAFHLLVDACYAVQAAPTSIKLERLFYRNGLLDMFCALTGQEEAAVIEQIDELLADRN